jgi:hypothetical protein
MINVHRSLLCRPHGYTSPRQGHASEKGHNALLLLNYLLLRGVASRPSRAMALGAGAWRFPPLAGKQSNARI